MRSTLRRRLVVLLAVFTIASLVACSDSNPNSPTPTPNPGNPTTPSPTILPFSVTGATGTVTIKAATKDTVLWTASVSSGKVVVGFRFTTPNGEVDVQVQSVSSTSGTFTSGVYTPPGATSAKGLVWPSFPPEGNPEWVSTSFPIQQ